VTGRIRWDETRYGSQTGHVGTLDEFAFQIWKPERASGEWVLTSSLPGMGAGRALHYGGTPDDLKPEAERLLRAFAASLGAVFPAAPGERQVTDSGPFESEREVRQLQAVRDIYLAFEADPGAGKMAARNYEMLCDAIGAAGVGLGAYDRRIVGWLSMWEVETAAVIAGIITRACEAGKAAGGV